MTVTRPAVAEVVAHGAVAASSAAEAAKGRDLVIAIVPEGDELGGLFFGEQGILAGIDPGTIFADMGSHSLETTMKMAEETAKKKVMYLDAPVWGSKDHAANGLMTIVIGGDPSLAGKCREPFSFFGLNTIHVGQIGDATKMKFIVNMVQAELVQVLAEGLVFGEKMGFRCRQDPGGPGYARCGLAALPPERTRHGPRTISPAAWRSNMCMSSCRWSWLPPA